MHLSLFILIIIPYLVIISLFIAGWFRKQKEKFSSNNLLPFVSVLIPVRDEEKNLPNLIDDLIHQNYLKDMYEIIFIDDHSIDNTFNIIADISKTCNYIKLISSPAEGKKAALWTGINEAKGEFIITSDGDCRYSQNWIPTMVDYYTMFPMHLIIGPVIMKQKEGLLNHFQNLEFLSLVASGAGSIGIGHSILCNGANLGANRSLFRKADSIYKSSVLSGDDIFLMLELKKHKTPMVFVRNSEAIVVTESSSGINQFIKQRSRWTFKSKYYRDPDIICVAVIVLFTNVILLGTLLYSFIHPQYFDDFLLFYLLKCFVDYILLYNVAKFFNRRHLLKYFLIHQLLYLFYVSFVGIAGHFVGEKWKTVK